MSRYESRRQGTTPLIFRKEDSHALEELESFRGKFGLGIERDLFFEEKPSSQVIRK